MRIFMLLPSAMKRYVCAWILGERDVEHRPVAQAVLGEDASFDERAVLLEHLNAVVLSIADVDESVVREVGAVHGRSELLRGRCARAL
jgi:hypothetical protein